MRHAILGVGGVGGFIGACLARIGEPVTLVVRPETLSTHPLKLHLDSPFGSWDADVTWTVSIPTADILWLKATQLEAALHPLEASASPGTIVPLLNGLDHLPVLRSKFGADRVIPATIAGEFERLNVGHIAHLSPFAILNISSRGRAQFELIIEPLRRLGLACNLIGDETTLMWTKLVFLGPFALATSAFDKPIGEVIADAEGWRMLEECVRETAAAGQAEGAKLDAEMVLKTMKGAPPAMRSSMQKDIAQGRPPELDAIGGAIVRAAHRHHLRASVTEELMAQIERRRVAMPRVS